MKQAGDNPSLSAVEAVRCVNQACDRFDAAWKQAAKDGRQPRIEDVLANIPAAVLPGLLRELVTLDMYYRRRAGETPQVQDYQRRFPQLTDLTAANLAPSVSSAGKRPQELGPYELLQPLGAGGMGEVYKARHRHLDRIVALKLIHRDRLRDEDAIRRFVREIRAAAQLNHPNIVLAYDADQTNGTTFFVMEYVEGTDLARLVKTHGPLSVVQACDAIRQAALGLQHAFAKGLIHRDIKPSNLLLTNKGVVKLLDLGLARWQTEPGEAHSTTLTETGAVMGTPDYIAPEQARAARDIDIRADLYSLGCTFYFLLAGQPPFPGGTLISKCLQHQTDEPEPVEHLRPELPAAVTAVVRRLMAKKREDRYQTPVELARALEELLPRLQGVQAGVGFAPPVNLFAALTAEPTEAQAAEARQVRRSAERRRWLRWNLAGAGVLVASLALFGFLLTRPATLPPGTTGPERATDTPGAQETWLRSVRALPPAEQIKEVGRKLREINPGYDGKLYAAPSTEAVANANVPSDVVTRLWPLRAFPDLTSLSCTANPGKLTDLSPLKGMRLRRLLALWNPISDLSPLEGMPLQELQLQGTKVANLAPLQGCPLVVLHLDHTPVTDLHPLEGRSLTYLALNGTKVTDLSPLARMPLRELQLGNTSLTPAQLPAGLPLRHLLLERTPTRDLGPLARFKELEHLALDQTSVSDLGPLKGLELKDLTCQNTPISDLTPLRNMPLESLWCGNTQVDSLAPLQGMKLHHLFIAHTKVSDLGPLAGMSLERLSVEGLQIHDLAPLQEMKQLKELYLAGAAVHDLSVLQGKPLLQLDMRDVPVKDVSPLRGMPLTTLWISYRPQRDTEVLKSLKQLNTITGKPVKQFWEEAGKPAPARP